MNKNLKDYSPSFCVIAPTEYLEHIPLTNTHLLLAHLVDRDDQYANFYRTRSYSGDLIIMDNGAYELKKPYSPEKLIELGKKCGADVIVLPDYPFESAEKTVLDAMKYAPIFKDAGFKTFFVPQSKKGDMEDWVRAYQWAANNNEIDCLGMSILGIPNSIPWCNPAYARVVMTSILQERGIFNKEKHHHYLGLNAGPALEIPTLIRMNALDTIDSSGPVWAGILGHQYTFNTDSYLIVKKLKMPVQFDYPLTKDKETLFRICHNIWMTLDLFHQNNEEDVWYAQE